MIDFVQLHKPSNLRSATITKAALLFSFVVGSMFRAKVRMPRVKILIAPATRLSFSLRRQRRRPLRMVNTQYRWKPIMSRHKVRVW